MVKTLIEEWINGRLGMPEVLERYQQLLKDRNTNRRAVAASHAQRSAGDHPRMSTYDFLEQVEKLIGGDVTSQRQRWARARELRIFTIVLRKSHKVSRGPRLLSAARKSLQPNQNERAA